MTRTQEWYSGESISGKVSKKTTLGFIQIQLPSKRFSCETADCMAEAVLFSGV